MHILISNDDGILSPGIQLLSNALKDLGHEITVVAPMANRSTVGHSLTLHKPLRVKKYNENDYAVSGSPADCIYIATRHLLNKKPDLVVSGINHGSNLGCDIFYSGTVAAAREGVLFGIPSIAVSLCCHFGQNEELHWDTAVRFMRSFLPRYPQILESLSNPQKFVLNINVPNLTYDKVSGMKISSQGRRFYTNDIVERNDPRGNPYYWIGGTYDRFEDIYGSDCMHVDQGYVSVAPLKIFTTDTTAHEELERCLENITLT